MEKHEPFRYMYHGRNAKTDDEEYLLASGESKVGIIKSKEWANLITDKLNSHDALLAACKLIAGLMGNLSLDQIEQVNGINDGRLRAGQLRTAIATAKSAIEQAGESGE